MKIPMTIPNMLSLSRIAMAPFVLVAAYYGSELLFFTLFGLMLLTDALDGYLARRWHECSDIGSKLDSIGDYVTYMTVPFATWWLWPEIIKAEWPYITAAILLFLVPGIIARIKFGQMIAYHTWLTKITAVLFSAGLLLLLFAKNSLLFHIGVCFLVLEAVENLAITAVMKEPGTNLRSLWHVLKNR